MNNIRNMKKKRRNRVSTNPEELAQQKLFEISRDQEMLGNESDTFLHKMRTCNKPSTTPTPKYKPTNPTNPKNTLNFQGKDWQKSKFLTNMSVDDLRNRYNELVSKKPISITNYIVIDERDKNHIFDHNRKKVIRYDFTNFLRMKMEQRNLYVRNLAGNRSTDCMDRKKTIPRRNSQVLSGGISIKNIKLFSKYPSFTYY